MRAQARGPDTPFSSAPSGASICCSSGVSAIVQVGDPAYPGCFPDRSITLSGTGQTCGIAVIESAADHFYAFDQIS